MALFQRRRALQRVLDGDWRDEGEKTALIEELVGDGISAADAIPLITARDGAARKIGVDRFVHDPSPRNVRDLLLHLVKQPATVWPHGVRVLASCPPQAVQPAVDALLGDKAAQIKRLAWDVALSQPGELGQQYIQRALEEASPPVRVLAVQRLCQGREPIQVLDILILAARDKDGQVVAAALERLVEIPDTRVIELMIDLFAHGDATARARATDYLGQAARREPQILRQRMRRLMAEGEDSTRRLAVEIMLATGTPAEVLLDIIEFAKDLVGWLRTRILETLQTFGDQILEPALELLEHPDDAIRSSALVLAERLDDPRIVGPVCQLLAQKDWWLRISACDTLGRLGDRRAVPHLVQALADTECRWAAIDALAQIGAPESFEHLVRLLSEPRTEVRIEVVRALGRFSDQRGIHLLEQVRRRDPASAVRAQATEVMRDLSKRLQVKVSGMETESISVKATDLEHPMDRLLAQAREVGASDLHFTVGEPPLVRINGKLLRLEGWDPASPQDTEQVIVTVLDERHQTMLREDGETDFCHYVPEVGRYRGNAYVQRKGICAAFRVIPNLPPTFADIRLPGHLTELLDYHQGLIVVSGSAGSGKSTTLTALINLINENKAVHIITLEDPVEFVHPVKQALVNQREVGTHTQSFGKAVRASLREDPDVIMVGEMRDAETIRMALMAAETGHLVIATLHTTSAMQTVDRLIKAFPPDEQPQVRMTLSETLKYVVCQSLLPRKDEGRVALFEILKNTFSVSSLIRDDKTYQIPNLMQLGHRVGMRTVDQALMELVENDLVTPEMAWGRAESPTEFEALCDASFLEAARTVGAEEEVPR